MRNSSVKNRGSVRPFSRDPKGSAFWPATLFLLALASIGAASDLDEFRVKREAVFGFAAKPTVARDGDRIVIRFETQGLCDVTVAIEQTGAVPKGVRNPRRVPDTLTNSLVSPTNGDRHLATARSQSPFPRSIGGDEVALFSPNYVATHTDRRLFIADAGNGRIVSVKLGYHTTERVALSGASRGKP